MAKEKVSGVVTALAHSRAMGGVIHNTAQVRSDATGQMVSVRTRSHKPPLPGTRITVSGEVVTVGDGRRALLVVRDDKDLQFDSGQMGLLIEPVLLRVLRGLNVPVDAGAMRRHIESYNLSLPQLESQDVYRCLLAGGVPAELAGEMLNEKDDRAELIASALTNALFAGMNRINYPIKQDFKNQDLPFRAELFPAEVLAGFMPDWQASTHGKVGMPTLPRKTSRFYLTDLLEYDAIDNFYHALAVNQSRESVYVAWMQANNRSSDLVNAFVRGKQKSGKQFFLENDLQQLTRHGVAQPEQVAARNGNMYAVSLPGVGRALISQGAYQAVSRLGTLEDLPRERLKPIALPNVKGLDPDQEAAVKAFCSGAPMVVISGPPGTGKTTTAVRMIEAALASNQPLLVMTPTGKAAARLNQGLARALPNAKVRGQTIHSFFYAGNNIDLTRAIYLPALDSAAHESFPHRPDRILQNTSKRVSSATGPAKVEAISADTLMTQLCPAAMLSGITVMIDESSQVTADQVALILAQKPARVILIGDRSQLPPTGPGKPFRDFIEMGERGLLGDRLVAVELRTDHRATKQLSAATMQLRAGTFPEDMVYPAEAFGTVRNQEFAGIECADEAAAEALLRDFYAQEIKERKPFVAFREIGDSTPSPLSGAREILLNEAPIAAHRVTATALPDVMSMAHTNSQVDLLAQEVKAAVKPFQHYTDSDLPHFAPLRANGLTPGDVLMQTVNDNSSVLYRRADNQLRQHANTMNGETYVYLGGRIWLPPLGRDADIDSTYKLLDPQGTWTMDPDFWIDAEAQYARYVQLKKLPNGAAKTITGATLGELMLLDYEQLRQGAYEAKTLLVPPKLEGQMLRSVWGISEGRLDKKAVRSTQAGEDGVKRIQNICSDLRNATLNSFRSGFACTVHKAQGSQARTSLYLMGRPAREDDAPTSEALGYTAVTRAEKRAITIFAGITAKEANAIHARERQKAAAEPSPQMAVALGDISPLGSPNHLTSAWLPGSDMTRADCHKGDALRNMLHKGFGASLYGAPIHPILEEEVHRQATGKQIIAMSGWRQAYQDSQHAEAGEIGWLGAKGLLAQSPVLDKGTARLEPRSEEPQVEEDLDPSIFQGLGATAHDFGF